VNWRTTKSTTRKKLKRRRTNQAIKEPNRKNAREKYYMKKDSEDIYIIEFEGDSIEKNNKS
jgi:hypothetical protein